MIIILFLDHLTGFFGTYILNSAAISNCQYVLANLTIGLLVWSRLFPAYPAVVAVSHAETKALMARILCTCELRDDGNSHCLHS